jgi:ABC-type antimicrobial peptide transport system permease subunit
MTGVYGVMAYVISQRLREMSIRMALGARPAEVMRLVIWAGLRMAAAGAAIGILGAVAFGRVLERFVFGIGTTDLATLAFGTAILLLAAIGATLRPALVAARAQPASALRAS